MSAVAKAWIILLSAMLTMFGRSESVALGATSLIVIGFISVKEVLHNRKEYKSHIVR